MIAVNGALTIVAKNVAIHIMTMQSAYCADMPHTMPSLDTSVPTHAPIASMGMNMPQETPAPRLSAVETTRIIRMRINVTTTGEENIVATFCDTSPPCVPSDSMNELPPPITDALISPNAPAKRKGNKSLR